VRGAGRAVHEVPGAELTLLVLDDQDAFATQEEEVLLHRLRVVPAGRPPRPEYAEGESRAGLDVLAEIRPTAQDEVVGLEDAAGLRLIVVHPGSVSCIDYKPPRRHRRETPLNPLESCFFNHRNLPRKARCASEHPRRRRPRGAGTARVATARATSSDGWCRSQPESASPASRSTRPTADRTRTVSSDAQCAGTAQSYERARRGACAAGPLIPRRGS